MSLSQLTVTYAEIQNLVPYARNANLTAASGNGALLRFGAVVVGIILLSPIERRLLTKSSCFRRIIGC